MPPKDSLLYRTLKTLWANPIVVLVLGDWRTGKTDTSLLCAFLSKKWGLIDKIGSNIWTFNNPEVEYITDMQRLKKWLHADRTVKLFIFDEGLKHIYRRTAMSKTNIAVIELLAELSKGHGRMILCSQIGKIDSDVLNPAFTRACWIKKSKKVMLCRSKHHPERTFINLPRSPIRFDPDRLAPFIDKKTSKKTDLGKGNEIYEVARYYASGKSVSWIKTELGLHQEKIKRDIRKALNSFVESEDTARDAEQENGKITETVNRD